MTHPDLEEIKRYYDSTPVQYELVKGLVGRETALLGESRTTAQEYAFRCLKVHTVEYLKSNLKAFNFHTRNINIYRSIAHLQDMPMFTYDLEKRKDQQLQFNTDFMKYATGLDLVFDFDGKGAKDYFQLWSEVQLVKKLFDDFGVPYTIKNSSLNGFHIEVDDKFLHGTLAEKLKFSVLFARSLKDLFYLKTLDLNIYNSVRRIWKTPYSIDYKSGVVALPLTDDQFETIITDQSFLQPDVVLPTVYKRGALEREFNYRKFVSLFEEMEEPELPRFINKNPHNLQVKTIGQDQECNI